MNLRTRVMLIGGLLGGLVGVLAAQLYLRSVAGKAVESDQPELASLEPGDAIKLVLSVLGVLKLVDGLGRPAK